MRNLLGFILGVLVSFAFTASAASYDLFNLPPTPDFSGAISVDCATSGASAIEVPASGTYWIETRSDLVSVCEGTDCSSGGSWKVSGFAAEVYLRAGTSISCRSPSGAGALQVTRSKRGAR